MSIYFVTTLNDNPFDGGTLPDEASEGGRLSLREAVAFTNLHAGDDTILFSPSLSGGTLFLTNNQITLFTGLTIDGDIDHDGRADITISADSARGAHDADSRIFNIYRAGSAVYIGL